MSKTEFIKKTMENETVDVYTTNGYKMRGTVVTVQDDLMVIRENGDCKCIMFSAISTVVPVNSAAFEKKLKG